MPLGSDRLNVWRSGGETSLYPPGVLGVYAALPHNVKYPEPEPGDYLLRLVRGRRIAAARA